MNDYLHFESSDPSIVAIITDDLPRISTQRCSFSLFYLIKIQTEIINWNGHDSHVQMIYCIDKRQQCHLLAKG